MKNIAQVHKLGVDLAKNTIQIYVVNRKGHAVFNRRFSRSEARALFEQLAPTTGDGC